MWTSRRRINPQRSILFTDNISNPGPRFMMSLFIFLPLSVTRRQSRACLLLTSVEIIWGRLFCSCLHYLVLGPPTESRNQFFGTNYIIAYIYIYIIAYIYVYLYYSWPDIQPARYLAGRMCKFSEHTEFGLFFRNRSIDSE